MKKLFAAASAVIVLASAGQAVTLDFLGMGDHGTVWIKPSSGTYGNQWKEVKAGEMKFKDIDATSNFNDGLKFLGYCLSPGETVLDPNPMTIGGITGAVGYLVQNYGVDRKQGRQGIVHYSANADAAGFQLAIWKLMDPNLAYMSLSLTTNMRLNYYLDKAAGKDGLAIRFNDVQDGKISQDIVTEGVPPQSVPVPEPFTMALAGMGLVAALRRKRK